MSIKVDFSEVGKNTLDRAETLLAGFPGGIDKALRSAMRRTAQHVRTQSGRRARERYAIDTKDLRADRAVNIRYSYAAGQGVNATILFRGTKIPLYRFQGTSPTAPSYNTDKTVNLLIQGQWRKGHPGVAAAGHQLKSTAPTRFDNGFIASFKSGHTGIFERSGGMTSTGRDEIRELMGSSLPQMVGNDEVLEKLSKDAMDMFDKRLSHEVDAIMNGWR
jgi:hypothetical protein